jgi:hypothetical protein
LGIPLLCEKIIIIQRLMESTSAKDGTDTHPHFKLTNTILLVDETGRP